MSDDEQVTISTVTILKMRQNILIARNVVKRDARMQNDAKRTIEIKLKEVDGELYRLLQGDLWATHQKS